MDPKEKSALLWVSENEGLAPFAELSASALNLVQARGLAKQNQRGRRKLQEDGWYLTEKGRGLSKQLRTEEDARIDPQEIVPDLLAAWDSRTLQDGSIRLRAREVSMIHAAFKEQASRAACPAFINEAWEANVENWAGSVEIGAAVFLPPYAAGRLRAALDPGQIPQEPQCL